MADCVTTMYAARGSLAPGVMRSLVTKSGSRGVIDARLCSAASVPGDVAVVGDEGVDDTRGAMGSQGPRLRARRSSMLVRTTREPEGSWSAEWRLGGGCCCESDTETETGGWPSGPWPVSNDG